MIVATESLTVRYGRTLALEAVDLQARPGSVLGVVCAGTQPDRTITVSAAPAAAMRPLNVNIVLLGWIVVVRVCGRETPGCGDAAG